MLILRRMEYEQGTYAPNHLLWQSILATILGVLFINIIPLFCKKEEEKDFTRSN